MRCGEKSDCGMKSDAPAAFAVPPRSLWLLGALALCTSVGEGAMADWSGLYLRDVLETSSGVAALGFAAFSVAMLIGRFSGDALVRRAQLHVATATEDHVSGRA